MTIAALIVLALGLGAWGGHWCGGHDDSPGEVAEAGAHPHAGARQDLGLLAAMLRGGGSSGASLYELHCHKMGLGWSCGPEAALLNKAKNMDRDLGKKPVPSMLLAVLHEQSQSTLGRGFEGTPEFSRDHVPKHRVFLSTSRLLL